MIDIDDWRSTNCQMLPPINNCTRCRIFSSIANGVIFSRMSFGFYRCKDTFCVSIVFFRGESYSYEVMSDSSSTCITSWCMILVDLYHIAIASNLSIHPNKQERPKITQIKSLQKPPRWRVELTVEPYEWLLMRQGLVSKHRRRQKISGTRVIIGAENQFGNKWQLKRHDMGQKALS